MNSDRAAGDQVSIIVNGFPECRVPTLPCVSDVAVESPVENSLKRPLAGYARWNLFIRQHLDEFISKNKLVHAPSSGQVFQNHFGATGIGGQLRGAHVWITPTPSQFNSVSRQVAHPEICLELLHHGGEIDERRDVVLVRFECQRTQISKVFGSRVVLRLYRLRCFGRTLPAKFRDKLLIVAPFVE
jgi:hypothetical protein